MVTIPRDVNDGRAIVAHELDVVPHDVRSAAVALATAVAIRDWPALERLLHDEVDFRGLTARRAWLAIGPEQVSAVLREWAREDAGPSRLGRVDVETVGDRHSVRYRIVTDGGAVCEHTAYFDVDDRLHITFVRMLASGARPPAGPAGS